MAGSQPDKPAILVLSAAMGPIEREVLAGIEEEGVPYLVEPVSTHLDAGELARVAADRSSLDVGVGIDAGGGIAILHEKLHDPVVCLPEGSQTVQRTARIAGHNAARIVVGIPLRTELP